MAQRTPSRRTAVLWLESLGKEGIDRLTVEELDMLLEALGIDAEGAIREVEEALGLAPDRLGDEED